jgi:meiotically up-regulated gene 157 (Mug157) protein
MQRDSGQARDPPYLFSRVTSEASDTLSVQSRGPPARPQHPSLSLSSESESESVSNELLWGLTRSLFRPSDDAVTLPYNIPGMHAYLFNCLILFVYCLFICLFTVFLLFVCCLFICLFV